ncbi:twin-arginine translocase TatA/TatE family subunit [Heliobacterium chlorum]|uniref:Sec-independent protein translocase protein TatA n=1 Tax=Heliobacterium chlorum TaxID=2698 RepID=A0ABR7T0S3_HELCL|nr:twin-arginine translocase TatA/TatE family subunit [Heliobacterium chlorum]MBC9784291.1 twin-arginine translocase TatA/TatE family subunit [Heliobacterium chlorum]
MFNIGFPELLLILALALIIFGPGKLPEVGRGLGKALNEFRRTTEGLKSQMNDALQPVQDIKSSVNEVAAPIKEVKQAVTNPSGYVMDKVKEAVTQEPTGETVSDPVDVNENKPNVDKAKVDQIH